jgi:glycosyltransferase involved in cell wall biosynthesis
MDNHFTIIVTAYNVENWVDKNLNSAFGQNYKNYDLYYVDDCSTDKTSNLVKKYFSSKCFNGKDKKFIKKNFNYGKTKNLYDAMQNTLDNTIIVILDGDDWLSDSSVLKYLNNIYQNNNIWMTNGSYVINAGKQIVKPRINREYWVGNLRHKSWEFSHLGVFRKKLYSKIKIKDLMNKQGEFYVAANDQAMMWPMAEMSGPEHHKTINEVLYVYNRKNPNSIDRVNREEQLISEQEIRNKKPYEKLQNL